MTQEFAQSPQQSQGGEPATPQGQQPTSPDSQQAQSQTAIGPQQQPAAPAANVPDATADAPPSDTETQGEEAQEEQAWWEGKNLDDAPPFREWKSKMDRKLEEERRRAEALRKQLEEQQRKQREIEEQRRQQELEQRLQQERDPRKREELLKQHYEERLQTEKQQQEYREDMQRLGGHVEKARQVFQAAKQTLGMPDEVQQTVEQNVRQIAQANGPYAAYEYLNDVKDDIALRVLQAQRQGAPQQQQPQQPATTQQQPNQQQPQQNNNQAQPVAAPSTSTSGPMTYKQRKQQAFRDPTSENFQQYLRSLGIK